MDIITTIGPSSWPDKIVEAHLRQGIRCIRFAFSKAAPQVHIDRRAQIMEVSKRINIPVSTMADLPGGKPRLNNKEVQDITNEREYRIGVDDTRGNVDFWLEPSMPIKNFHAGNDVLIGDGEDRFFVHAIDEGVMIGRFSRSMKLAPCVTFLPTGANVHIPCWTDKDKDMARQAQSGGFDWLAISFADSAATIIEIREWLEQTLNWKPFIIAKIETLPGVLRAEEIAQAADSVMVARGDLGMQLGLGKLWEAEKIILRACKKYNCYSIVATGILENFDRGGYASRAEAIDLALARDMGASAIMFTAETTIGPLPVEAVQAAQELFTAMDVPLVKEEQIKISA